MSRATGQPGGWPQIAVVGAGAVGGYFGGMLAAAGAPVVMIGRKPFADAVRRGGFLLETEQGERCLSVEASPDIAAAKRAEVILFSVKTSDTKTTARALAAIMRPGASVISLQNGVDNIDRIRDAAGIEALAAAVYVAAYVVAPGHVRHLARGDLVVGPEARNIAELFTRANIPCRISENIAGELWAKLASNCALNALSALARVPYGRIIDTSEGRTIVNALVDEVFAVARALWVKSPAFEKPETLRAGAFELAQQMPTTVSSTAQDLRRGKRTEIDSLNGYISRRGAELVIPTPVNDTVCALIKLAETNASDD